MTAKRKLGSTPTPRRSSRSVSVATARVAQKPAALDRYKLLALDLDGTLLNQFGVPDDADVAAIRKLR